MAVKNPQARQDCERAKALYLAGLPPSEIAQRLGINSDTLKTWSHRGKWFDERKRRNEAQANILDRVSVITLADSILQHQKRVSAVVDTHIDNLSTFQPIQAKEFVEVGQALKHFDDVGRRNLGLTESSGDNRPTTFNFNLANAAFERREEKEIIDIASAPLPVQSHDTSSDNEPNITKPIVSD